jgi:hypothetical protein
MSDLATARHVVPYAALVVAALLTLVGRERRTRAIRRRHRDRSAQH